MQMSICHVCATCATRCGVWDIAGVGISSGFWDEAISSHSFSGLDWQTDSFIGYERILRLRTC